VVEAGVVMALVGAALLVVEAHVPAGFVGAVGAVVLAGGVALAIAGAGGGLGLVIAALLAAGTVAGAWLTVVTRKALGTRRLRAASGREALSGRVGVVRNWYGVGGQVFVDGALWRARRSWADEEGDLRNGDPVVVEQVKGLTLAVRKAEEWEEQC
jgi:membrane-bound ClpP family serine protease